MIREKTQINRSIERLGWMITLGTFFVGAGYIMHKKDMQHNALLYEVLRYQAELSAVSARDCEPHLNIQEETRPQVDIVVSQKLLPPQNSNIGAAFWVSGQFVVMKTEVTNSLYAQVFSLSSGDLQPKAFQNIQQAQEFADNLSLLQGFEACYQGRYVAAQGCLGWRIPLQKEWMMFASAGQGTAYSGSDVFSDVGWSQQSYQVASKPPNQWGLFDMSGGRTELILDPSSSEYKQIGDTSPLQDMKAETMQSGFGLRLIRAVSGTSVR